MELLSAHFLAARPDAFLVHVHQVFPIFSTFFFLPLICFLFSPYSDSPLIKYRSKRAYARGQRQRVYYRQVFSSRVSKKSNRVQEENNCDRLVAFIFGET